MLNELEALPEIGPFEFFGDHFKYFLVQKYMAHHKWSWFTLGVPNVEQIKSFSNSLITKVLDEDDDSYYCSSGGITVIRHGNLLSLSFSKISLDYDGNPRDEMFDISHGLFSVIDWESVLEVSNWFKDPIYNKSFAYSPDDIWNDIQHLIIRALNYETCLIHKEPWSLYKLGDIWKLEVPIECKYYKFDI